MSHAPRGAEVEIPCLSLNVSAWVFDPLKSLPNLIELFSGTESGQEHRSHSYRFRWPYLLLSLTLFRLLVAPAALSGTERAGLNPLNAEPVDAATEPGPRTHERQSRWIVTPSPIINASHP